MMLHVLASGSSGNCYMLKDGLDTLLLDAGIIYKRILQGLGYQLQGVVGALITHEHQDHAAAVKDLLRAGIPCCITAGTREALGMPPTPPMNDIRVYQKFTIGPFVVIPFPAKHDAADPVGFLIRNTRTGEQMVYATDTYYLPHTFPSVNYWLVECNYSDHLITDETPEYLRKRLLQSHMSLDRLCGVFRANDLTVCRQIVLCHLSGERGDAEYMTTTIRKVARKPVTTAIPGAIIPLNMHPF